MMKQCRLRPQMFHRLKHNHSHHHRRSTHHNNIPLGSSWSLSSLATSCTGCSSSKTAQRHENDNQLWQLRQLRQPSIMHQQQHMRQHHHMQQHTSLFHTTTKKEILPLIAIGTVAVLGTYSYKALQKMDEEWEEYEEALREYKLEHGLTDDELDKIQTEMATGSDGKEASFSDASARSRTSKIFTQGKMAIDLGSTNIRIGYYHDNNTNNNKPANTKPKIIVNREGGRSTPNSILIETDGSILTGTMANAKVYERSQSNNPVLNPYNLLQKHQQQKQKQSDLITTAYAVENVISNLARDALEQALGGRRKVAGGNDTGKVLFTMDDNDANAYNTQPILTYPPSLSKNTIQDVYQKVVSNIISPPHIAKFIPEPICAVKGARYHKNLLPPKTPSTPSIMVIDIGGKTTSISIVNEDTNTIQYSSQVQNFGGETIIEAVMNYLSKSFYNTKSATNVSDTMGVQRLYDASKSALKEIGGSKHGRVQINIPYLSVDEQMKPRHLDVGLSVKVLEAELEDLVKMEIIPNVKKDNDGGEDDGDDDNNDHHIVLSQSMNNPTNLEGLFSSMIMNVFERSNLNPFMLNSVLIIGGGARSPLFQKSVKCALSSLAGEQFVQEKVVIPSGSKGEELVVIGAMLVGDDDV